MYENTELSKIPNCLIISNRKNKFKEYSPLSEISELSENSKLSENTELSENTQLSENSKFWLHGLTIFSTD